MNEILYSVVIPTHRRPEQVRDAVDSVMAQSDPRFELLVVCDGDDPETQAALLPFLSDRRIHIIKQTHAGVSTARNTGIAAARGTWIAFLDDDDRWHPEKLARQAAFMAATGYLASQCDEIWIRNGTRVNAMKKHAKPSGWIFPQAVERCCVSPSAVMLHRSLFARIGLFNPDFPVCEDYELWLRLALAYPVGNLPMALLTKYGGHADQLSRRFHSMDIWRVRALEGVLNHPILASKPQWQALVRLSIITRSRILAQGAQKHGNPDLARSYSEKHAFYADMMFA